MNLSKSSINDVLSSIRRSDVFLTNVGIDLVADKNRMLSEVFVEKNIDVNSTLATLNLLRKVSDEDLHWLLEPTASLINHIKSRYHCRHRLQLPQLISLARQVENSHQGNPSCPLGLADYLNGLHEDLLVHMEREEQILFPFLCEKKMSYVFAQVSLALHNHDQDIHVLNRINGLTNELVVPQDADEIWKELYVELAVFKADLLEHVRLENDILFERCR